MRLLALLALLGAAPAEASESELDRTWTQGRLTWLQDGHIETGGLAASQATAVRAFAGRKAPAVVYLHGCAGLDRDAAATAAFLASAGYIVAAPDSFARTTKPESCNIATQASSLHRGVLGWRQAEAARAVAEIKRWPFVDANKVYLYGFSEGGIAVATLTGVTVRARVIEGWSCHSGWPEYAGLRAPWSQPVLALASQAGAGGDCGDFMHSRFGARSVVFRLPDPLSHEHHISGHAEAQAIILAFLRSR